MSSAGEMAAIKPVIFLGVLACSLQVHPADAGPRAWVASTGGGVACTRAAPCATFSAAVAAVDPGGEINCVDAADYGPITGLAKSLTIDCTGTGASITQPAPGIDAIHGLMDGLVVTLRGLRLDGLGVARSGINLIGSVELHVENCRIANFRHTPGSSDGISLTVFSDPAKVYISDTIIEGNGDSTGGAGISLFSTGGALVAVVNRTQLRGNPVSGLGVSGSAVSVNIRDSSFADNGKAIEVFGGDGVGITVDRTTIAGSSFGIVTEGPASSFITLSASTVMGNGQGVSNSSGGTFFSYGDNQLSGNISDLQNVTLVPLTAQ